MPVTHADLAEMTRMEFVHVDASMMLATSITTASRMLAVLSHTAITARDGPSLLTVFTKY